jgi:hypothetical protein
VSEAAGGDRRGRSQFVVGSYTSLSFIFRPASSGGAGSAGYELHPGHVRSRGDRSGSSRTNRTTSSLSPREPAPAPLRRAGQSGSAGGSTHRRAAGGSERAGRRVRVRRFWWARHGPRLVSRLRSGGGADGCGGGGAGGASACLTGLGSGRAGESRPALGRGRSRATRRSTCCVPARCGQPQPSPLAGSREPRRTHTTTGRTSACRRCAGVASEATTRRDRDSRGDAATRRSKRG